MIHEKLDVLQKQISKALEDPIVGPTCDNQSAATDCVSAGRVLIGVAAKLNAYAEALRAHADILITKGADLDHTLESARKELL